ncbi:DoxX family protein [Qingshengfaniella alkalisoli]|uniref:DoxX family protein n=1 Tax=Qingshengfaniella alkalisoli TaxID=2599296 RepID=A0A5B8I5F5_9RHOB|nr:DoxX family protein [Qingshengfaniella alkalisoli]QDY68559.1 DoxX family protein [Qingshengfaniella alkalisoli]
MSHDIHQLQMYSSRVGKGLNPLLPPLARLVFAGTLLIYFWASAMTKLGDGFFGLFRLSSGAYVQIFPRAMETVGYDPGQLSWWSYPVVLAGTYGEFVLPLLIVIGLLTRIAALGMIGFIAVQSLTDIYGHGLTRPDIGMWFDRDPSSLIADQRTFWTFVLLVLVVQGGGALSLDRVLAPYHHQSR